MIIDLATAPTYQKPLKAEFAGYEIDLAGEARLTAPAVFSGEIFRDDTRTYLGGMITATVEADCTRCLEPVIRAFEIPFRDVFVDASMEATKSEAEIDEADLDESLVIGGRVDLAEVVREQILLALPEQILCKEDCGGLCPICGGNRNLIDCSCENDEIDPRWAGLRDLK
ncbi:MAG: DUF177 domain-containing protein [Pyrinomonadaceae bacterium]|nr:DUF177 domain-containing protein [Pyrinomonadaceae bacterium]